MPHALPYCWTNIAIPAINEPYENWKKILIVNEQTSDLLGWSSMNCRFIFIWKIITTHSAVILLGSGGKKSVYHGVGKDFIQSSLLQNSHSATISLP